MRSRRIALEYCGGRFLFRIECLPVLLMLLRDLGMEVVFGDTQGWSRLKKEVPAPLIIISELIVIVAAALLIYVSFVSKVHSLLQPSIASDFAMVTCFLNLCS